MRKKLYSTTRGFFAFLLRPVGKLPFSWHEKFLDALMAALTTRSGYFHTFHQRPKRAQDVATDPDFFDAPKIAVVIQGPVVHEEDFTLETVKLYGRTFPGSLIIVSTWEGEDETALGRLRAAGAAVVQSALPPTRGTGTMNYQMVSTLAGLRFAKENGMQYAVKTRCDQRFYASGLPSFLLGLLKAFPVTPGAGFHLKERIVGININTARYRPYGLSDMFQFGFLEDLIDLWDMPLDPRSLPTPEFYKNSPTALDISKTRFGEAYMYTSYMEKIGRRYDFSYRDHYTILKHQFVVVDKEHLDLFWFKYGFSEYRVASAPAYLQNRIYAKVNFSDWLAIFNGDLAMLRIDEKMLHEVEF